MDNALLICFLSLTVLFSAWNLAALLQYLGYRRIASSSELTWYPSKPWFFSMCLGIGFFMVTMIGVSVFVLSRPLLTIIAQALMALYYTVLFPLTFRIRRGFYESGIWTERRFIRYRDICWLGWKEKPDLILALRTETKMRQGYVFLKVPGECYGQARRILADRINDNSLSIQQGVLGLQEIEEPAQERV